MRRMHISAAATGEQVVAFAPVAAGSLFPQVLRGKEDEPAVTVETLPNSRNKYQHHKETPSSSSRITSSNRIHLTPNPVSSSLWTRSSSSRQPLVSLPYTHASIANHPPLTLSHWWPEWRPPVDVSSCNDNLDNTQQNQTPSHHCYQEEEEEEEDKEESLSVEDSSWDAMFGRLCHYKVDNDSRPSCFDVREIDPAVGMWLLQQRQLHSSGDLSEERYTRLIAVGFAGCNTKSTSTVPATSTSSTAPGTSTATEPATTAIHHAETHDENDDDAVPPEKDLWVGLRVARFFDDELVQGTVTQNMHPDLLWTVEWDTGEYLAQEGEDTYLNREQREEAFDLSLSLQCF